MKLYYLFDVKKNAPVEFEVMTEFVMYSDDEEIRYSIVSGDGDGVYTSRNKETLQNLKDSFYNNDLRGPYASYERPDIDVHLNLLDCEIREMSMC